MARQGRPPKFSGEHRALLAGIVEANPLASMNELRAAVERSTGVKVHGKTLEKHLLAAGIERRRDTTVVQAQKTAETKTRYGYTDAHRRLTAEQVYPSCLTDTVWALVKEVFENHGGRAL